MNIAFYNHTSDVSGAEISLLLTAKHLQQAKPVLFAPEGELLQRARSCGLETVAIPSYRARLTRNPLLLLMHVIGMLRAGYLFAKQLRKHRIDAIHANSLRAGIMASLFCWMHRRPVVWHIRDNPPQGAIGKAIGQLASTAASAMICISDSVVQGFDTAKLKDKLHLVHNGVPIRVMTAEEKSFHRQTIRGQLNTPQSSHVLVIIGQIAPWKRQEDAIRAAHRLIQDGMDVYLWVVGEPKFREENESYRRSLGQLVESLQLVDRVRFTGFREDVLEICSAADLLLLCSDNEPFGRVLIEAMSQSLPIIATDAGGPREIIENDTSGLLYEVGDTERLAMHAAGLLSQPGRRLDMERNAFARVKGHFTIERTVEKIEAVYRQIIPGQAQAKVKFDQGVGKEVSP